MSAVNELHTQTRQGGLYQAATVRPGSKVLSAPLRRGRAAAAGERLKGTRDGGDAGDQGDEAVLGPQHVELGHLLGLCPLRL
jgi:hypothetical protein